jgi:aminotransferase
VVLTDEIYSELTYDEVPHHSIAALPGMKERTLFLHGFSKAFAMTGWRIGYACGPADIIEAMMKIHQYSMLCAPIMAQEAAFEALERGTRSMERMREEYRLRRNFIVSSLNEAGIPCHLPKGAFYVFPDIRGTGLSSRDFSLKLLETKNVAVVPGTAFGTCGEGYVRCSYATAMDQIKIAVERISDFVKK